VQAHHATRLTSNGEALPISTQLLRSPLAIQQITALTARDGAGAFPSWRIPLSDPGSANRIRRDAVQISCIRGLRQAIAGLRGSLKEAFIVARTVVNSERAFQTVRERTGSG
jgi:hypothetical protein